MYVTIGQAAKLTCIRVPIKVKLWNGEVTCEEGRPKYVYASAFRRFLKNRFG